ncbi:bacillithiol biosynthesis deacetylase BshB1 [Paenibacillus sp. MER TA 81-3]|uniref:bacillithiol biosynthesis deacetylase BshB1 n=1 Tax=Paenibacillus sp. MER TA 81-3 TaxID=2939573 RepID=UPI00203F3E3E|nr:bacillithiol biosynthesis deacetylase BshB1 [Paenibacillus sp. MER TA 81-3]MCM3341293.1 bacillithiol biosynthesis deacetylase BshB1 [Paenibacillus sp. MER TA 81-3]
MNGLDILAFGAHPDDVEIGMAGTIAKHTAQGFKVGICDLTEAEMSSNGTVDLRREEAKQASVALRLSVRENLRLPDRGLQVCSEHIDAVVEVIRRHRPRIVFMPYWEDRHPDHIQCSRIVQEAVFNAKLRRYLPELDAHLVEQVYFYFINDVASAQLLVDVTAVYDMKRAALHAYASQFTKPDGSGTFVATPLNQGYVERVEARDTLLGQTRGFALAEGFVVKGPYAVSTFL